MEANNQSLQRNLHRPQEGGPVEVYETLLTASTAAELAQGCFGGGPGLLWSAGLVIWS